MQVVRGAENWSLESETVKYGLDFQGTRTLEWLRWRGPAEIVKTDLSSRQRERPKSTNPQLSESNKNLVVNHRWVLYSKTEWHKDRRS
jgi:hypothetical protein